MEKLVDLKSVMEKMPSFLLLKANLEAALFDDDESQKQLSIEMLTKMVPGLKKCFAGDNQLFFIYNRNGVNLTAYVGEVSKKYIEPYKRPSNFTID